MRAAVSAALASGYGVACTRELTLVLQKGATNQTLPPVLAAWLAGECRSRGCIDFLRRGPA